MWESIKKVLVKNQGVCIVVEDGRPAFVVARFDDYQQLLEEQPALSSVSSGNTISEQDLLEKINQEITDWKAKQVETSPELEILTGDEDLKVEDLPLL
jgi:hypothetical protein